MKTKTELEKEFGKLTAETVKSMNSREAKPLASELGIKYVNVKLKEVQDAIIEKLNLDDDEPADTPEPKKEEVKKDELNLDLKIDGKPIRKMNYTEKRSFLRKKELWDKSGMKVAEMNAALVKYAEKQNAGKPKKAPASKPKATTKKGADDPCILEGIKYGRQPNGIVDEEFIKTVDLTKKEEEILRSTEHHDSEKVRLLIDAGSELPKGTVAKILMRTYSMVFMTTKNYVENNRKSRPYKANKNSKKSK